jgi:hypothetical protein
MVLGVVAELEEVRVAADELHDRAALGGGCHGTGREEGRADAVEDQSVDDVPGGHEPAAHVERERDLVRCAGQDGEHLLRAGGYVPG